MKPVQWTAHARDKLKLIQNQGFIVDEDSEDSIVSALHQPQQIVPGFSGRLIAQAALDDEHIIRVAYEETNVITVVTLYAGRHRRYES